MKISKYTFLLPKEDDCTVLYNCFSEALAIIESELGEVLASTPLDEVRKKHLRFYTFLEKEAYILPDDTVEEQEVIAQWEKEDSDARQYSLFINPTLDCNLRCWYCFENHVKGSLLKDNVLLGVKRLISHKVTEEGVKMLNISFFGGEPFVAFDQAVMPLIRYAEQLCSQSGCDFCLSFVTNATLVDERKVRMLAVVKTAAPITFQITLDGNRMQHDEVKKFPNDKGSYDLVLKHIRLIAEAGMPITLRFNMTEKNAETYFDVLTDLEEWMTPSLKELLTIDLQHVWQDRTEDTQRELSLTQQRLREAFLSEGYQVNELKHIDRSRCYADRMNHVSINFDGSLYKCTARDFNIANREGVLNEDGTITWNEKFKKRMQLKYGNKTCLACRIFPLCHGGCSQHKLNCEGNEGCIRGYNELDKRKIVEDRVDYLLERLCRDKQ